MKSLKKSGFQILKIAVGSFFIISGVFYIIYEFNQPVVLLSEPTVEVACGTANLPEKAVDGKKIFNSYCAACHKLDKKSTGPALKGIDSLKYRKFVLQNKTTIDTAQFNLHGIDYHQGYFVDYVTAEDFEKIYQYIKE